MYWIKSNYTENILDNTELNPTILKIFHVSQSVTEWLSYGLDDGLQELLELLIATKNQLFGKQNGLKWVIRQFRSVIRVPPDRYWPLLRTFLQNNENNEWRTFGQGYAEI